MLPYEFPYTIKIKVDSGYADADLICIPYNCSREEALQAYEYVNKGLKNSNAKIQLEENHKRYPTVIIKQNENHGNNEPMETLFSRYAGKKLEGK